MTTEAQLNKLAGISAADANVRRLCFTDASIRAAKWREKRMKLRHAEALGRFAVGDRVRWGHCAGTVVQVVPSHRYPEPVDGLRVRGYYREDESYIVVGKKGAYWPHASRLRLSHGV